MSNATTNDQSGAIVSGVVSQRAGGEGGPAVRRQDHGHRRPADLNSSDDVSAAVAAHQPGEKAKVTVVRGGNRRTLTVTLGTRPENGGRLSDGPRDQETSP